MTLAATADPWRWQPHPEVWLLVAGVVVLYVVAVRRIGPRAVRDDERVVTRANIVWFACAVVVLLVASDWPVHDIAEEYLYSVHMAQHLLLSFLLPPLLYFATPTWLARLVVGDGRAYRVVRRLGRPVTATLLFNGVVVLSHWPAVVNASASNGALHYGVHLLVVASALLMWLPVCGPLPELRISIPLQMPYLFLQSIIPTIPAGWLTFAEGAVYDAYDTAFRLGGVSVADDQQMAGLIMKLVGGAYLWTIITVLFFRFAAKHADDDRATGVILDRRAPAAGSAVAAPTSPAPVTVPPGERPLTWDDVAAELERAGPPPPDPHA